MTDIRHCANFDELHRLVTALVNPIDGIGELYCYDTALRIGAYLKLFPEKVYLHSGTRVGAIQLGFTGKEPSIEVSRFPAEFQSLDANSIEDILCIYKQRL